jgi:hypothetical protein
MAFCDVMCGHLLCGELTVGRPLLLLLSKTLNSYGTITYGIRGAHRCVVERYKKLL